MRTIKLTLEYDGTDYVGWQRQLNGRAVQQVVEEALAQMIGAAVGLHSSGRTDAGVHARGMVAHFRTSQTVPVQAFRDGVNRFLPRDIVVRSAEEVSAKFHARFDARGKWYRYSIYQHPVRSPLYGRTSWHLRSPLNVDLLSAAAAHFVGQHDFAAFRTSGCVARSTCREIFSTDVVLEKDLLHIDVRGSGFLRCMVRLMVGTLVEVGLGKRTVESVPLLLKTDSPIRAGLTAPPQGLCLMQVWY